MMAGLAIISAILRDAGFQGSCPKIYIEIKMDTPEVWSSEKNGGPFLYTYPFAFSKRREREKKKGPKNRPQGPPLKKEGGRAHPQSARHRGPSVFRPELILLLSRSLPPPSMISSSSFPWPRRERAGGAREPLNPMTSLPPNAIQTSRQFKGIFLYSSIVVYVRTESSRNENKGRMLFILFPKNSRAPVFFCGSTSVRR